MTSSLPIDGTLSSPNAHNSTDRCAVQGEPRMEGQEDLQDVNVQNLSSLTRKETAGDGSSSNSRRSRQRSKSKAKSHRRARSVFEIPSDPSSSDDSSKDSDTSSSDDASDSSDLLEPHSDSTESSESSSDSSDSNRGKRRSSASESHLSTRMFSRRDRGEGRGRRMFLEAASVLKQTLTKRNRISGKRLFDTIARRLKSGAKKAINKGERWTYTESGKSLKAVFPDSYSYEREQFGGIMWKMCKAVERSHSGTLSGGKLKERRRREGSHLKQLLKACQQGDRGEPPTKKRKVSATDERYYRDALAKVEVKSGDTVVTYDSVLPKVPFSFFKQAVQDVRRRFSSHNIPNKYWVEWGLNLVKGALNAKLIEFKTQFESSGAELAFDALIAEADKLCGVSDTLTVKRDAFFALALQPIETIQDFNKRLEARASELIGMGMPRSVAQDIKTYLLLKAAEKSPVTRAAVPGILATSGFEPERLCHEIIRIEVENARKYQSKAGVLTPPPRQNIPHDNGLVCRFVASGKECYMSGTREGCTHQRVAAPSEPRMRTQPHQESSRVAGGRTRLNQIAPEPPSDSFLDLYGKSEGVTEVFRIGDDSLESKKLEKIQLDGGAGISFIQRRTAEAFAKAGLAEWDIDPPFRVTMANGVVDSCRDAVILRMTKLDDGATYHIRFSVLDDLADRILIGRSAFAQIGRYDLLADAEKAGAREVGKEREHASQARFAELRQARQRNLANSLERVCKQSS